MGHTYSHLLYHIVFSTQHRRNLIVPDLQPRLWSYMGGIARENNCRAMAVGGTTDHAHLLLLISPSVTVAHAVQRIKAGSSKWISETFPNLKLFRWQEGYGAFSLGITQLDKTFAYIEDQRTHHHQTTFQEEFVAFLKKHRIEYDERYVWG